MPDEPTPEPEPTPPPEAEPETEAPPPTASPQASPPPPASAAPPAESVETGYTTSGVPTFESVREKIETRYGTAIGASELAAETPEGRSVEEQYDARQKAAAERLKQIRESMNEQGGSQ
jgi:hypothetical protein